MTNKNVTKIYHMGAQVFHSDGVTGGWRDTAKLIDTDLGTHIVTARKTI